MDPYEALGERVLHGPAIESYYCTTQPSGDEHHHVVMDELVDLDLLGEYLQVSPAVVTLWKQQTTRCRVAIIPNQTQAPTYKVDCHLPETPTQLHDAIASLTRAHVYGGLAHRKLPERAGDNAESCPPTTQRRKRSRKKSKKVSKANVLPEHSIPIIDSTLFRVTTTIDSHTQTVIGPSCE